MLNICGNTLSELCRIRRRWSLSLSRGSFTRRTNERLYSRRLADLWSAEVERLVCSRARYKSPRESACILKSRPWPGKREKQSSIIVVNYHVPIFSFTYTALCWHDAEITVYYWIFVFSLLCVLEGGSWALKLWGCGLKCIMLYLPLLSCFSLVFTDSNEDSER